MSKEMFFLPICPPVRLRLDSGALVDEEKGIAYWWEIEEWLDKPGSFVIPVGPPPKRKQYALPGPRGYNG